MPRFLLVLTLFCLSLRMANAAEPDARVEKEPASPTVTVVPELDKFLIIPLRVYRLKSTDLPAANCELTDQDLRRIVGKVNRVWAYGGIYFGLESIQEEAAATDRLLRLPEKKEEPKSLPQVKAGEQVLPKEKQGEQKGGTVKDKAEALKKEAAKPTGQGAEPLLDSRLYRALIPPQSREFPGFRVFYIHQFDVNGIYYGRSEAMVKDTARLRKVSGGIDEPIPRVTAHELGHGLSLPHRQDNTNLMASGTSGTSLNESEIKQAREAAGKLKETMAYADLENFEDRASRAVSQMRTAWANDLRALHKELEAAQKAAAVKGAAP
jgi:hypothetical protein